MANGIVIDGVTQPQGFGLGLGALGSQLGRVTSKVGDNFYTGAVSRGGGAAALLCLQAGQRLGVPEFAPRVGDSWLQTCGQDGGPSCDTGDATASINGLSGLGNFVIGCSTLSDVVDEMYNLAGSAAWSQLSLATQNAVSAATVKYDSSVYISGSSCSTDTTAAQAILSAARSELGAAAPPLANPQALVPPPPPSQSSGDNIKSIVMWSAIGLASVAGAYALGPLFRGLGSLIHPKGR